jgi:transcriptional regulator with XRE-family HTH domain
VARNRIKELRTAQKLTQKELATFLNVDHTVVSKWESGKLVPTIEQYEGLRKLFKLDDILDLGK